MNPRQSSTPSKVHRCMAEHSHGDEPMSGWTRKPQVKVELVFYIGVHLR